MTRLVSMTLLLWGATLFLSPLYASGRSEGSIQKTWDYDALTTLVIDADRQDVVIKEGGPRVTGRLVGESGDETRVVRDGEKLTISVRGDGGWFSWHRKSARIELSVPQGTFLDVTTASGAILVEVSTASLRARSASGDIEAPRGGAAADVDSTSGTVRLRGFSGPVKASSLSGDLLLEDLSGEILAATLSGNLKGHRLTPEQSRFSTVSGDADLSLVGGSEAYIVQTESVSGRLEVGDHRAEGELAIGSKGPVVVVKTVSGDVRVR